MTTFRADVDQMIDLASRLSVVAGALDDEGHAAIDASVLGDGDAVGAMGKFVSGWSHGRGEIVAGVHNVSSALRGAAQSYRGSDQGMAARLTPQKG